MGTHGTWSAVQKQDQVGEESHVLYTASEARTRRATHSVSSASPQGTPCFEQMHESARQLEEDVTKAAVDGRNTSFPNNMEVRIPL